MSHLLTRSFSKYKSSQTVDVEMAEAAAEDAPSAAGVNLDKFFHDVETVKADLREIEELLRKLKESHEESKIVHNAKDVKDLRSSMETDVSLSLRKAKLIKMRLEALDRGNAANRKEPGCGPGSSADRTRTSVVNGLRKKLKEKMDEFQHLRERIKEEYRETVSKRYITLTGENPGEKTLDMLISTGESETFLQKAIQEQGRGNIVDAISEIQERHDAAKDMERNLKELRQVFLDMAVLVHYQGEQMDDIEAQVQRSHDSVKGGTERLQMARKIQKDTRKWICLGITLVLIIILVIVLALHPGSKGTFSN